MASSVFPAGVEDDIASFSIASIACNVSYWLYSMGLVGVITAMFTKIWMLSKVFTKPRSEQRLQITRQDILLPFFVIFGLQFLILAFWAAHDPYHWERIPIHESGYSMNLVEESTYGVCTAEYSYIYVIVLILFHFTIVGVSLIYAY